MTERVFVVVNKSGLNVRSKPDTKTGTIMRVMSNGEGFRAMDVFAQGNQVWARVSRGDERVQEYACLAIGNIIYAREQTSTISSPLHPPTSGVPTAAIPSNVYTWMAAVDQYLRSQGYSGPKP
jgi:hypothetical protein